MTEEDLQIQQSEAARESFAIVATAAPFLGPDGQVIDPFDDAALEQVLAESARAGDEPALILVDRTLKGLRYRREC